MQSDKSCSQLMELKVYPAIIRFWCLIFLVFLTFEFSMAQSSGSITVEGDIDKYYPVTWLDGNWGTGMPTELHIGRPNAHTNSTWRGSLMSTFTLHSTKYGHGSHFINAHIKYIKTPFIGGWRDASSSNNSSRIIIWLKGGGTTYYYIANADVQPIIYDGVQNPLPFDETNGPSHTYKTTIDDYVNSFGSSQATDAYFGSKVGIGTNYTSNGKLTIASSSQKNLLRLENNGFGNETILRFRSKSPAGRTLHADIALYDADDNVGFLGFKVPSNNTVNQGYNLIINKNGNVGIGTTTPDEKFTVKGNIHAEEVRVDLSVPGPDYVFEPDYDLQTLEELAQYIKVKKHLPEVPSAAEMEEEGIELSKMNILLLKKIEELTLYILQLEKKNQVLEQKVDNLLKSSNTEK